MRWNFGIFKIGYNLYECSSNSEPGDLVKVSIKNSTKIGLIKCVFDLKNSNIGLAKIKSAFPESKKIVSEDKAKTFLLALIDEYKDGIMMKEELYAIMEHFVEWNSPVDLNPMVIFD